MANIGKIKIVTSFADESTRDVVLEPFDVDSDAIENAKTNIKNFDPAVVKDIYLSDGGATCTGISAATITTVEETEINLNVSED